MLKPNMYLSYNMNETNNKINENYENKLQNELKKSKKEKFPFI